MNLLCALHIEEEEIGTLGDVLIQTIKRQPSGGVVFIFLHKIPEKISSDTHGFLQILFTQTLRCPCSQLGTDYTKQLFIMNPSRCFVWYWKLSCGLVEPHRLWASLCRPVGVQLIPVLADDSFPQSKQSKLCVRGRAFVRVCMRVLACLVCATSGHTVYKPL